MTARTFVSFRLRCDLSVLLGDRQLQGSFTLFHVCRAQDAELRPLFGSRKRPSAARSVFHTFEIDEKLNQSGWRFPLANRLAELLD